MSIDPHYNTPAWFQPEELEKEKPDALGTVVREKLPGKRRVEPVLADSSLDSEEAEAERPEPPLADVKTLAAEDKLVKKGPSKDAKKS